MKLASLLVFSFSAYSASLGSGGADSHGVWENYETRLEPSSPPIHKYGGGVLTTKNIIKRHLCNFDNNTYFGYDLSVEPISDNRYRMVFGPLTMPPHQMTELFKEVPSWVPLALPGGPATMEVRAGETVALDLFVNPSTGQKVTDYLTIKGNDRQEVKVTGEARDFSPEDATIAIMSPRVTVDGKELLSSQGGISGQAVWIDVPGHGRFVFSLAARPDLGMQKAGEIRGSTLAWHSNGHDYAIATDGPIASGSRAYNVYVFYVPRNVEHFGMSAGPRPDPPIRAH
jgi:hypothetical protein